MTSKDERDRTEELVELYERLQKGEPLEDRLEDVQELQAEADLLGFIDMLREQGNPELASAFQSGSANPVGRAEIDRDTPPTLLGSETVEDEGRTNIPLPPIELPEHIGRYRVERLLGKGGYGLVLLAFDPQLKRQVALKIPRIETLLTEEIQRRFMREAEAAASLNHAHIVPVFDVGRAGPIYYIASAYCDGISLAEWLGRHQEPVAAQIAARLVSQVADAVQHAHSRGVLHRDLKPSNILLADRNAGGSQTDHSLPGQPLITDFGLALLQADDQRATTTGSVLGTPAYMSPEQASGGTAVGPASDIYSLGCILYELLTGRPPFEGKTLLDTLRQVRDQEPLPLRRQRPEVPRDLEAIALKCLEKDPARRYQSGSDLVGDLERFLSGEPVRARRASSLERAARWCRRRPALAGVSALLLIALLAGAATSTALYLRAREQTQELQVTTDQLGSAMANLQGALDELFVTVAESPELKAHGAEPLRQALLAQAEKYYRQIVRLESDDPQLLAEHARTLFLLARVHSTLGSPSRAEELLKEATASIGKLPARRELQEDEAEWRRLLGKVLFDQGRIDEGRDSYNQAISLLQRASQGRSPSTSDSNSTRSLGVQLARLWSELASAELAQQDLQRATEAAETAYELWGQYGLTASASLEALHAYGRCLLVLGMAREQTGQLGEAERLMSEAVMRLRPIVDNLEHDPHGLKLQLGRLQQRLGIAVARQNRLDEARTNYLDAISQFEQLSEVHPRVPEYQIEHNSARYSLSVTEYLDGDHDRTIELLEQNISSYADMAERFPEQRTTYVNRCGKYWNMIYVVHAEHERWSEAEQAIQEALRCYRQVAEERPDWIDNLVVLAEGENNYGNFLLTREQYSEGQQQYEAARDRLAALVESQPMHERARETLFFSHAGLSNLHVALEDYELALVENDRALELLRDRRALKTLLLRADILDRLGRTEGTLDTLQQSQHDVSELSQDHLEVARQAAQLIERRRSEAEPVSEQAEYLERLRELVQSAIQAATPEAADEREALLAELSEDELLRPFIVGSR